MMRWVLWMLLLLLPVTAMAKEVELLPAGTVWADGSTRAVVMLRVTGARSGGRIKVRSKEARIRSARVVGPDLVRVVLVPLARDAPGSVSLSVKTRGASSTVELPVVPGPSGHLSIEPATQLAWAGSGSVLVRIKPQGPHPVPESQRKVLLHASAGRITSPPQPSKSGGWFVRWTPPAAGDAPVAVLFTATDLSAPERVVGQTSLPVQVRRTVRIEVPEGAVVIYDGQPSKPVHGGHWSSRLVLHPEKLPATLQTLDAEGRMVESPLDLGDPVSPQVAFAPLPSRIPSPRPLTLWLAARDPDGSPWSGPPPMLEGVGRFKSAGDGWYVIRVQPPSRSGTWTLNAKVGDQFATARVTLEPEPPAAELSLYPFPLSPDARSAELVITLRDREGNGVPGIAVTPRGKGFSSQTHRNDEGDGTYSWTVRPTTSRPLTLGTRVTLPTSRLPVAHVLAWTSTPVIPADGRTTTEVSLVAVDALGRPVPKARFDLAVPVGDAHVPARVYADGRGFATVRVVAGTRPGPVGLEARTREVNGAVVLYQATAEGIPALEAVGSAPTRAYAERWGAANLRLGVPRGTALVFERPPKEEEAPPQASLLERFAHSPQDTEEDTEPPESRSRPRVTPRQEEEQEEASEGRRLSLGLGEQVQGASEESLVRARLVLVDAGYQVRMTSNGQDGVPTEREAARQLPAGIVLPSLQAEFFPQRWSAGLDLRLRGRGLGWETTQGKAPDVTTTAVLGVCWREPIWGPISATGGLAAQRSATLLYRYADDAETVLTALKVPYWGWRLAVGLRLDLDPVHARVEAAETMAPLYPVATHLSAQVDVRVWEMISVSAGASHERRSMTLTVGETGVVLKDQLTTVELGASVTF